MSILDEMILDIVAPYVKQIVSMFWITPPVVSNY